MSAASNSPQQLPALSQKLGEVILIVLRKNIFYVATSLFSKTIFMLDLLFFQRCVLSGKEDEQKALTALNAFTALANEMIIAAEPALCANLPNILQACGSKNGNIRTAADAALQAICSKMSANAVPGVSCVTSKVFS